ncbi:putative quinol monooxygenase [Rouxiella badensis]|jgi:quinol monooxygenase YgiN|uniref:Antibiotic biosynthesis monooxygenase n=1 Tax=Rouxiella badensis TaxID=1646377 RepID=A0A1X0WGC5_9GAMM|nr:putative quinol monooxygenase [Rouxiella badensis]MCC3701250.1 antibiotic biosynthesis monooxygenase [Rouxiella badensis]MCC3717677.1 antibiotic biosynthesis monooxygenase [Rouxiella badensis]MCC3727379.1 antibiotic biosynthesis monooxygenase [Rouxiella badensis]MCC3732674.1 antibiotic biosynthesis monooxygenase [Rouxiella badensis]MCC3739020.1 antibiotic biosynthesis monooxygenase [Rouxiella badensis]
MEIRIVAPLTVKPEFIEEVTTALLAVVSASREELGCLQYDLHREIDNPNNFVFYERWRSDEAIAQHEQSAHFKHFVSQIEGKLEKIEIKKLKLFA